MLVKVILLYVDFSPVASLFINGQQLAPPGNSALYPNIQINDDTLSTSYKAYSIYLKSQFVNIYGVRCNIANCFVCDVAYFSPLKTTQHKTYPL